MPRLLLLTAAVLAGAALSVHDALLRPLSSAPGNDSADHATARFAAFDRLVDERPTEPAGFIANRGQWDHPAAFVTHHGAVTGFVEAGGWVLDLAVSPAREAKRRVALRIQFEDAAPAQWRGHRALPGKLHYFVGDPERWRTDVRRYAAVRAEGLYPGVAAQLRSDDGHLAYDLLLAPRAALDSIVLRVDGADRITLDPDGALLVHTPLGVLRQQPPTTWQIDDAGAHHALPSMFVQRGPRRFGFQVPDRDADAALLIDPGLQWSTVLPGAPITSAASSEILAVDVAPNGVTTVCGGTRETAYPTTLGVYSTTHLGQSDAFVSQLDPRQTGAAQLIFSTFVGGNLGERALNVVVGSDGAITIAGQTASTEFPTTIGAYDRTHNGNGDMFVTQLDPAQTGRAQLRYSTLVGGLLGEFNTALWVDDNGVITATGDTSSPNFPITPGAYDPIFKGGPVGAGFDVCVIRLDPALPTAQQLTYSTFLGSGFTDSSDALFVDQNGIITCAGETHSPEFPKTADAFDATFNGKIDAWISVLDPTRVGKAQLLYGTLLGGAKEDMINALWVDANGVITVGGDTLSSDFPVTANAFDATIGLDSFDFFFTTIDRRQPPANQLLYSTFMGGIGNENLAEMVVDESGAIAFAGESVSIDFPTTAGAWDPTYNHPSNNGPPDVIFGRLRPSRTGAAQLEYASYFGGTGPRGPEGPGWELVHDADTDALGQLTAAGATYSDDFPTTAGAFANRGTGGFRDGFAARMDLLPRGASFVGNASAGCAGDPRISVVGPLTPGSQALLTSTNGPPTAPGVLLLGAAATAVPIPLLGVEVWVDLLAPNATVPSASDGVTFAEVALGIPPQPQLVGNSVFAQFLWLGPSAPAPCPATGLSATPALQLTVQ